ncbi:MAG: hypothetical protein RDV48_19375 [Candidatus Eremiobacteraeota bacterium]|nr:hypothetical protein [Candidatus Eremiobacteraeota bacterium]
MPLPAVAIVIAGVGAVSNLIGTGMFMHQQSESRKDTMEYLKMMSQENTQRRAQLCQFLQQSGNGNTAMMLAQS